MEVSTWVVDSQCLEIYGVLLHIMERIEDDFDCYRVPFFTYAEKES